jgi:hypothetical protein
MVPRAMETVTDEAMSTSAVTKNVTLNGNYSQGTLEINPGLVKVHSEELFLANNAFDECMNNSKQDLSGPVLYTGYPRGLEQEIVQMHNKTNRKYSIDY